MYQCLKVKTFNFVYHFMYLFTITIAFAGTLRVKKEEPDQEFDNMDVDQDSDHKKKLPKVEGKNETLLIIFYVLSLLKNFSRVFSCFFSSFFVLPLFDKLIRPSVSDSLHGSNKISIMRSYCISLNEYSI